MHKTFSSVVDSIVTAVVDGVVVSIRLVVVSGYGIAESRIVGS